MRRYGGYQPVGKAEDLEPPSRRTSPTARQNRGDRDEARAVAQALGRIVGGDDGASWDDDDQLLVSREWARRAYRVALEASADA